MCTPASWGGHHRTYALNNVLWKPQLISSARKFIYQKTMLDIVTKNSYLLPLALLGNSTTPAEVVIKKMCLCSAPQMPWKNKIAHDNKEKD